MHLSPSKNSGRGNTIVKLSSNKWAGEGGGGRGDGGTWLGKGAVRGKFYFVVKFATLCHWCQLVVKFAPLASLATSTCNI